MAKIILNVLLKLVLAIANLFLAPINLVVSNFFPDLTSVINSFTTGVNLLINQSMSWFAYMIPPLTLNALKVYLTFLVGYYAISYTAHGIIWALKIVKKLPFT